jgi:hypothetical protein
VFSVQHDAQNDAVVAAWRTRFLENALWHTWLAVDPMSSLSLAAESGSEFILMAGDPALPADAQTLAWRAPAEEEDADDEPAALASAWRAWRGGAHWRACSGWRPELWTR